MNRTVSSSKRTLAAAFALGAAVLAGTAAVVVVPTATVHAADFPEPSLYPVSWEFTFDHGKPKRIVMNGANGPQAYWYMTYRVSNLSDDEQMFLPVFEIVTKDGEVVRSDQNIPKRVFQQIKGAEGNEFLEARSKVVGPLRVGEDQARDAVAIWPEISPEMGEFSVFVGGLSGEFVYMDEAGKPVTAEQLAAVARGEAKPIKLMKTKNAKTGEEEEVLLRKTLQLDYVVYGDERAPDRDEVVEKGERWVMR